jgi:hypothetical protein
MKLLRESIRLILREANVGQILSKSVRNVHGDLEPEGLDEAMQVEPPEGSLIWISGDERSIQIRMRDRAGDRTVGMINVDRATTVPDGDFVWEVSNVEATEHGYGPMLYDIAMELIYLIGDGGLMPDRAEVSQSARGVWKRYYEGRAGIEKSALPEDMFDSEKLRERPEYMRHYYSKTGTPILSDLNAKGLIDSEKFRALDLPEFL